jgi:hypothetical protein
MAKLIRRALTLLAIAVVVTGCAGEPDQRVLFVGNSYTHFNDLPGTVEQITDAHDMTISWDMIAPGGSYLDQHAINPEVLTAIQSGEFDTVIFQEQSVITSVPDLVAQRTLPAALSLDATADSAGVRVMWFQTWGRLNGFPDVGYTNYTSMQDAISATYNDIGRQTGALVIPVGDTWRRVLSQGTDIGLFSEDGSHPSPAGSYLAALQISEALVGRSLTSAPGTNNVDDDQAAALLAAMR